VNYTWEVCVSVLTRNHSVKNQNGLRDQAVSAYRQLGPLAQQAAQQAAPYARNAGASVQQGTDSAVAWATPKVDAARSWAAPQLEQSARAISDSIAPMISGALLTAAQKIDAPKRQSHGSRKGMVAGTVLLTAAAGAGAAAVYAMLHRQNGDSVTFAAPAETGPAPADLAPSDLPPANTGYDYDESGNGQDVNGRIV
jgi:hypothetical protein